MPSHVDEAAAAPGLLRFIHFNRGNFAGKELQREQKKRRTIHPEIPLSDRGARKACENILRRSRELRIHRRLPYE
jgi:hypothetical protein